MNIKSFFGAVAVCASLCLVSCLAQAEPTGGELNYPILDTGAVHQRPNAYASVSRKSIGVYVEPKVGLTYQWSGFTPGRSDSDFVLDGGLSLGYDWFRNEGAPFRIEAEYMYLGKMSYEPDTIDFTRAKVQTQTVLGNIYYDYHSTPNSAVVPYFGVGAGIAISDVDMDTALGNYSETKTVFAFQVGTGISFQWGEAFAWDINARWLSIPGKITADWKNADYEIRNGNGIQVTAGIRFTF